MLVHYDAVVVGGGFYGLRIALHLRQLGLSSVLVLEKEPELMDRASYANQARVHNGYHYPRSILTAYRSRVNSPAFVREYADAVVNSFEHYYAIASRLSKINARQFELFCSRIGAHFEQAESEIAGWFNPGMVETVYRVTEPAFDSRILRDLVLARIMSTGGIELQLNDEALQVEAIGGTLRVTSSSGSHTADQVINASYSRLNELHRRSGLPSVPLQHEIAELSLVELPAQFTEVALTVMDGPFFSIMPFPERGLHTLSHVRYTPQRRWHENGDATPDPHRVLADLPDATRFPEMYADVLRYIPGMRGMTHKGSIREVKTVLPKSASDDSRPILFKANHGIQNFTVIMGGKIDNIYDALEELNLIYAHPNR
jgi:glycine/D-amino acid oxidase-like deaminating enzyme